MFCKTLRCDNLSSNNFRKFICCYSCDDNFSCDTPCKNAPIKCKVSTINKVVQVREQQFGKEIMP